jgi:hypothetical protein
MWKNPVEADRPQVTIWRMCITYWIPKATNTHSECIIFIPFPLQQWLHESASVLHYRFIALLVKRNVIQYAKRRGSDFVRRQSLFRAKRIGK